LRVDFPREDAGAGGDFAAIANSPWFQAAVLILFAHDLIFDAFKQVFIRNAINI
jgi:hypothetical protein